MHLGKRAIQGFCYTALPLSFAAQDSRTLNAMLGMFTGYYIGKGVAGVALMLANKKKKEQDAGYGEEKSGLKSLFNKENRQAATKYLLAGTALAAAGYIGANTAHDINQGRTPIWALAGNTIDAAYVPVKFIFAESADFGQLITHNLNPLPPEYRENPLIALYGRKLDGYTGCFDKVMDNTPGFAGTCHDKGNSWSRRNFDR